MTETNVTFFRNAVVAACAALVSGVLWRPQISSALVERGDQRLYRGSASAALPYYHRALAFAPGDGVAIDRYAFSAILLRDRRSLQDAVAATTSYLPAHPFDDRVRADRAFALRLLGEDPRAERDFFIAGSSARDPRLLTLAGYSALRAGDRHRARTLWRDALSLDRSFRPASLALARH